MYTKSSLTTHHIRDHASVYVFITLLFLIGIIFGAVIVNSMNFIQKQDLYFYLNNFFGQVLNEPVASSEILLKSSFLYHLKYLLFIFILGLSIIGMPIIWILLFMKGVVVGFSVGFLVNQMGWYGLFMSAASIAPQNLVIIPVYILAGSMAMIFSLTLIQKLFAKKAHQPLLPPFMRYSTTFIILLGVISVAVIIESYISSEALKGIVKMIYE